MTNGDGGARDPLRRAAGIALALAVGLGSIDGAAAFAADAPPAFPMRSASADAWPWRIEKDDVGTARVAYVLPAAEAPPTVEVIGLTVDALPIALVGSGAAGTGASGPKVTFQTEKVTGTLAWFSVRVENVARLAVAKELKLVLSATTAGSVATETLTLRRALPTLVAPATIRLTIVDHLFCCWDETTFSEFRVEGSEGAVTALRIEHDPTKEPPDGSLTFKDLADGHVATTDVAWTGREIGRTVVPLRASAHGFEPVAISAAVTRRRGADCLALALALGIGAGFLLRTVLPSVVDIRRLLARLLRLRSLIEESGKGRQETELVAALTKLGKDVDASVKKAKLALTAEQRAAVTAKAEETATGLAAALDAYAKSLADVLTRGSSAHAVFDYGDWEVPVSLRAALRAAAKSLETVEATAKGGNVDSARTETEAQIEAMRTTVIQGARGWAKALEDSTDALRRASHVPAKIAEGFGQEAKRIVDALHAAIAPGGTPAGTDKLAETSTALLGMHKARFAVEREVRRLTTAVADAAGAAAAADRAALRAFAVADALSKDTPNLAPLVTLVERVAATIDEHQRPLLPYGVATSIDVRAAAPGPATVALVVALPSTSTPDWHADRLERSAFRIELLQTLAVAVVFVAAGILVFGGSFQGTRTQILEAFFWGFAIDMSMTALLTTLRGLPRG